MGGMTYDPIATIRISMDGDSELRRRFEALRDDLKNASNHRKSGNAAVVRYAINKAYDAMESEDNLYEQITKTKHSHIPD